MQIALVLLIMVAAVVLFVSERFSIDLVALMVLGALVLTGLVTPDEGISGFSNQATVTVAAMFILSAGLQKNGGLTMVAGLLFKYGRNQFSAILLIGSLVALVSAFINNTAAVAVFLPLVITLSQKNKIPASRMLIPLSYASQFGGVCTLIGTSTNLLVSSIAVQNGLAPFSMFEFSRLGLVMVLAGTVYLLFPGRWLLPDRGQRELVDTFGLGEYIAELQVMHNCSMIGKTILESRLGRDHDVTVIKLIHDKKRSWWAPLRQPLAEGDVLLVRGRLADIMALKNSSGLELHPEFKLGDATFKQEGQRLLQVLIPPASHLTGQTLKDIGFRNRYQGLVLAVQRRGRPIREKISELALNIADILLVQTNRDGAENLRRDDNFLVLDEVDYDNRAGGKTALVLGIIGLVIALPALNIMPILVSAILGCLAMVLTNCLNLEDAYEAIDWKIIFLLAGILPLGIAMTKSGAAALLAEKTIQMAAGAGPVAVLAAFYFLTAVITAVMSNNASAVLLAPIAISTAAALGVDAKPFLMAITFAASTSFATPIGYQTNAMIYNAGGYRYTDFIRVGLPLNLVFWIIAVILIPRFWPF